MRRQNQPVLLQFGASLLTVLLCNSIFPLVARCQNAAGIGIRGRRGEIDVIIRDSSGDILSSPASVKLFLNGTPYQETSTSNGRISFTVGDLGKFTVAVEAAGYKPGQNDINLAEPVTTQLEIRLQAEAASDIAPGGAAENPILAPKAKEALEKGMQALRDDKLDEAQKAIDESAKLAPNHPDVLYVQGLLELKKHEWTKAQSVLEKSTQIQPNSALALSALGMALCNQKKYAEAIPPLEKSLKLDPVSNWETRLSLGESYYHSERYDDALKLSQQAQAESDGQAPQVDLLVARALTAVGRYEDSAKVLRDIVKNHGDASEAATARRYLERLTNDGKIKQQ